MKFRYVLALGLLLSGTGFGHARFRYIDPATRNKVPPTNFEPRNGSTGLKSAECGQVARTASVPTYKPGQTLDVEWEETIDHGGYFVISFSEKGATNFIPLIERFDDNQNNAGDVPHQFKTTITLPNVKCTDCTIQLKQIMIDGADNVASKTTYYSCSDFILSDDAPNPTPEEGGTTPVTPTPEVKPAKPTGVKVQKK